MNECCQKLLDYWRDGFRQRGLTLHLGLTPEQNAAEIIAEVPSKDYKAMRDMQSKFIEADHKWRALELQIGRMQKFIELTGSLYDAAMVMPYPGDADEEMLASDWRNQLKKLRADPSPIEKRKDSPQKIDEDGKCGNPECECG